MKKKTFSKKLHFKKETISSLTNQNKVVGGAETDNKTCNTLSCGSNCCPPPDSRKNCFWGTPVTGPANCAHTTFGGTIQTMYTRTLTQTMTMTGGGMTTSPSGFVCH